MSDIKPGDNWSMPFILARIFGEIWLSAFVQFGQVENADTVMILKACQHFLESELICCFFFRRKKKKCISNNHPFLDCDSITKNAITLDVDKDFYAEHLSTTNQIQKTSENRHLIGIVEKLSLDWMRIIERILIKGKRIRCNASNTGPIDELEYWLQTHSMYSIAQELISTQTFQHHMKCLQQSGSKLVHVN